MTDNLSKTFIVMVAFILWAAVTASGVAMLLDDSSTPGVVRSAPVLWPQRSMIPHGNGRLSLVVFLHPKCPCSRATVAELAEIMANAGGNLSATVLTLRPASGAADWDDTRLARTAAAIPGVIVRADFDEAEAARFRATTSGETFLYDARGRLQFHGGITGARGHIGGNAGHDAVQSLVLCGATAVTTTATFGCPLRTPSATHRQ